MQIWHYIPVRFEHIIVQSAKKISYDSLDFMTLSNIRWFLCLLSTWKLTGKQYFKSLANKSNSQEPHSDIFFVSIYTPKEVSFDQNDDQKSFNADCNNKILHFCTAIMDFLFWNVKFFSFNNTIGRVNIISDEYVYIYFK